jgi:phosphoribosylanthranilate isomerase
MRIKICGITTAGQGIAIAKLGVTALGFMCVRSSPRYIQPSQIKTIAEQLPSEVDRIGVFANASHQEIEKVVSASNLSGVQLHGDESPQFCQQLRNLLGHEIELWKALRIKTPADLLTVDRYKNCVDTLLLDAYHPQALGGTGKTLDWENLKQFRPNLPWFLAGGLTPNNVTQALSLVKPDGIDLSSGVERSPGDKDLVKVAQLLTELEKVLP